MGDVIRETGLRYRIWGKGGKDDELGSLNYISPEAVVKAARWRFRSTRTAPRSTSRGASTRSTG